MAAGLAIDAGLRAHMQRVYSYMAGGLALTGIVAYAAAVSGFYRPIAGTPLIRIVILAPLGFVLAQLRHPANERCYGDAAVLDLCRRHGASAGKHLPGVHRGIGCAGVLPGDIVIERGNMTFYFPLMTCLLVSVLLSLVFWVVNR
jgi:FtsH-binding integral membrane protein